MALADIVLLIALSCLVDTGANASVGIIVQRTAAPPRCGKNRGKSRHNTDGVFNVYCRSLSNQYKAPISHRADKGRCIYYGYVTVLQLYMRGKLCLTRGRIISYVRRSISSKCAVVVTARIPKLLLLRL